MKYANLRAVVGIIFLAIFGFAFSLLWNEPVLAKTVTAGAGKNFTTIQEAVNAASDGDVVEVAPGTYKESLTINKPLTLIGGSAGKAVISGISGNYIVKIDNADGVVLDNLEINGEGSFDYGILVNNSGDESKPVQIKNSTIKNIWKDGGTGIGIEGNSYALVSRNNIYSFQKNGVRFVESKGKVYENTVTGVGVDGIKRVQNLVNLRNNSNVEIYNNTLYGGFTLAPSPETLYSPCVFVNAYPANVASYGYIHDNDISLCDVGVIVGTRLMEDDASSAEITSNSFHDLYLGVSFQHETNSAQMESNSFNNVSYEDNRTSPGLEQKLELAEAGKSGGLMANAFSALTLGTKSGIVGMILVLAVILLLGQLAKRYIQ